MTNWNGPVIGRKDPRTRTKGAMAALRVQKRLEAEERDKLLPQTSPKRKKNKVLDRGDMTLVA